jgi:hypothetical protein
MKSLEEIINNAKALFPDMPEDVFNIYLRPLIKVENWPFTSVNESLEATPWRKWFGGCIFRPYVAPQSGLIRQGIPVLCGS